MITKKQAFELKPGDVLISNQGHRWRVNGKVQTWKREENKHRIRVPLKFGLYDYDFLDETHFDEYDKCYLLTREADWES